MKGELTTCHRIWNGPYTEMFRNADLLITALCKHKGHHGTGDLKALYNRVMRMFESCQEKWYDVRINYLTFALNVSYH